MGLNFNDLIYDVKRFLEDSTDKLMGGTKSEREFAAMVNEANEAKRKRERELEKTREKRNREEERRNLKANYSNILKGQEIYFRLVGSKKDKKYLVFQTASGEIIEPPRMGPNLEKEFYRVLNSTGRGYIQSIENLKEKVKKESIKPMERVNLPQPDKLTIDRELDNGRVTMMVKDKHHGWIIRSHS